MKGLNPEQAGAGVEEAHGALVWREALFSPPATPQPRQRRTAFPVALVGQAQGDLAS